MRGHVEHGAEIQFPDGATRKMVCGMTNWSLVDADGVNRHGSLVGAYEIAALVAKLHSNAQEASK